MSGRFGAGNDERFNLMLEAANRFLGVGKLICMIDLVAYCRIGFGFMGQLGIRGDAFSQVFATLVVRNGSAEGEKVKAMFIPPEDQPLSSSPAPILLLTMGVLWVRSSAPLG